MTDLIPQPHGGAIRPFAPGNGAARGGSSFKAIRRECRELMAQWAPQNFRTLQELCNSGDERVSVTALSIWFDRFFGKAGDTGLAHEDRNGTFRLPDDMTAEDRREAMNALMVLQRLANKGEE